MYKINLNCDLGEGAAYDEQIIPLINSANIACGFHAGNHDMMEATAKLCIDNNVAAGTLTVYRCTSRLSRQGKFRQNKS